MPEQPRRRTIELRGGAAIVVAEHIVGIEWQRAEMRTTMGGTREATSASVTVLLNHGDKIVESFGYTDDCTHVAHERFIALRGEVFNG